MSAYGKIHRTLNTVNPDPLQPRTYALPITSAVAASSLTVFPLRRETAPAELIDYLAGVFNEVVKEGRTYPQKEVLSVGEFVSLVCDVGMEGLEAQLPQLLCPICRQITSLVSYLLQFHSRRRPGD